MPGTGVAPVPGMALQLKRPTAEIAGRASARVFLASRNETERLEAVTRIRQAGGRAFHIVADVGDPETVDRIGDLAVEQFGGIDTWVTNAGVGNGTRANETDNVSHLPPSLPTSGRHASKTMPTSGKRSARWPACADRNTRQIRYQPAPRSADVRLI